MADLRRSRPIRTHKLWYLTETDPFQDSVGARNTPFVVGGNVFHILISAIPSFPRVDYNLMGKNIFTLLYDNMNLSKRQTHQDNIGQLICALQTLQPRVRPAILITWLVTLLRWE